MPAQAEPFSIFEDKKEEPAFQIYEDKLQTESELVLRNVPESKLVDLQQSTELKLTLKQENTVEVLSLNKNVESLDRPVLQEIQLKQEENAFLPEESPMSLDRSVVSTGSEKNDSRSKREACKASRTNFYDIDEYRADIYHYFRTVEVSILMLSKFPVLTYIQSYFSFIGTHNPKN